MKNFVITKRCEYLYTIKAKDFIAAYQKLKTKLLESEMFDPKTEKCELIYVNKVPALHITKETKLERFYLFEEHLV